MKSSIDFEKKYTDESILSDLDSDLESNPPAGNRFFEVMQSGIHLEHLINPTYTVLEQLIKGRREITHSTMEGVQKEICSWANGDRSWRISIVECIGSEREIKPENIYKIYPEYEYFNDVKFCNTLQKVEFNKGIKENGIRNPFFGKPNLLPSEEFKQDFYLPIFITDKKNLSLTINTKNIETTRFTELKNILNSAFTKYKNNSSLSGDQGYQVGRVVSEAKQIVSQDNYWKNANVGFILVKLSVDTDNVGWTRLAHSGYYFYSLKPNTVLNDENILGVEIGYLPGSKPKLTTIKNNLMDKLPLENKNENRGRKVETNTNKENTGFISYFIKLFMSKSDDQSNVRDKVNNNSM